MAEFTLPLDIKTLKIIGQRIDHKGNITFTVESNCTSSTCHKCGQLATKGYGYSSRASGQNKINESVIC